MSLGIGYEHEFGDRMALSQSELNTLYSKNIIFESRYGYINVYGLLNPTKHMFGVTDRTTIIANNTGRQIKFWRNQSAFRELFAYADGGMFIEENLNTTDGELHLNFYNGNLNLSQYVDIIATGGDLVLTSNEFHFVPLGNWTVVNEGSVVGVWSIGDEITESSDQSGGDPNDCSAHQNGTMLVAGDDSWEDYTIRATIQNFDDDAVGFVFGYRDEWNYYKFVMSNEGGCSTIFENANGTRVLHAMNVDFFDVGEKYQITLYVVNNLVTVYMNGTILISATFSEPVKGGAGLYSSGNSLVKFTSVLVEKRQHNCNNHEFVSSATYTH